MKICLIGKYPPIEGGVSTQNYFLAKGLGALGHTVYVVTNAYEVESDYRMALTKDDLDAYQPRGVHVFNTNPFSNPKYIPYTNPYVTKLAGIATKIVKDFDVDIIYSHYLEPYLIAGHTAKSLTGVPLVFRHAGSDIGRLLKDNILYHLYSEVLKKTDLILTTFKNGTSFFEQYDIEPCKVFEGIKYGLDPEIYNPDVDLVRWEAYIPNYKGEKVLLCYGKMGETKGTHDILRIAGLLQNDFKLMYITSNKISSDVHKLIQEYGLKSKLVFSPFIFPTQIPRFIRSSTMACFLERRFPIKTHGPIIPREIIATGSCLVLSKEIYEKQYFKKSLVDGDNFVLLEDVEDHHACAKKIDALLEDDTKIDRIGRNAYRLFCSINKHQEFLNSYMEAFEQACKTNYRHKT